MIELIDKEEILIEGRKNILEKQFVVCVVLIKQQ